MADAQNLGTLDTPWSGGDGGMDLSLGLAGYLTAVAEATGVPPEGTSFEVSDTATAYLALNRRWPALPDRDVMLVWSERAGWMVSVETDPSEQPIVIARFGGSDPVPDPEAVAQFVTDALARRNLEPAQQTAPMDTSRVRLVEGLRRYAKRM